MSYTYALRPLLVAAIFFVVAVWMPYTKPNAFTGRQLWTSDFTKLDDNRYSYLVHNSGTSRCMLVVETYRYSVMAMTSIETYCSQ